jgi:hypothetical protein
MTLEKVFRDIASWGWLYLAAKPPHVGFDVDGIAYPLHRPTACRHQTRGQGFLSGTALSHRTAVGSGAFPRDAKPLGLDICWSVDRLGTYATEFYMEYIVFTRICLLYVRVIMVFMCVSLVELLF